MKSNHRSIHLKNSAVLLHLTRFIASRPPVDIWSRVPDTRSPPPPPSSAHARLILSLSTSLTDTRYIQYGLFIRATVKVESRVALNFYFQVKALGPGWLLYFLKYIFDMTFSYPKPSFPRVILLSNEAKSVAGKIRFLLHV